MSAITPAPVVPSRAAAGIRFITYTLILFASWNYNLLGLPDGVNWSRDEIRSRYLGSESHLVVMRLAQPDLPPLHPLCTPGPDGGFVPYSSQVGLTGIAMAAAHRGTGLSTATIALAAAAGMALLAALVLASIFASAQRWLGAPTGDIACVLAASTPVFLPFAPSLYWALALLLAPFALVWCLYPRAGGAAGKAGLLAAVAIAVMLKSLCGYEYITTVILAPVAAAWFHQHRAAERVSRRLGISIALISAGLLGFATAMYLHVEQQRVVFGHDGIAVIRDRAIARISTNPAGEIAAGGGETVAGSRWGEASRCFLGYFEQRAVSVAGGFGRLRKDIPLWFGAGLALVFAGAVAAAHRRLPRDAGALAAAILIGLAASLSWQVLAVNHMCVHRHLNLIVFTVPFLPLAYVASGYTVRLLIGPRPGAWVGATVVLATAGAMVANVVIEKQEGNLIAAEQVEAETLVAARLGGTIPPPMHGLGGGVDRVRTMAEVPPAFLTEYGLLDLETGRPADPRALVLEGWAIGDCKPSARPRTQIVAASGGNVVECRTMRFRRPDVERLIGKPVEGTGFVAVVPSAALQEGNHIQLFLTAGPSKVVELNVPGNRLPKPGADE